MGRCGCLIFAWRSSGREWNLVVSKARPGCQKRVITGD